MLLPPAGNTGITIGREEDWKIGMADDFENWNMGNRLKVEIDKIRNYYYHGNWPVVKTGMFHEPEKRATGASTYGQMGPRKTSTW